VCVGGGEREIKSTCAGGRGMKRLCVCVCVCVCACENKINDDESK
jgi:hypothetical protein